MIADVAARAARIAGDLPTDQVRKLAERLAATSGPPDDAVWSGLASTVPTSSFSKAVGRLRRVGGGLDGVALALEGRG